MYSREDIQLRELRGSDAPILLDWENNQENWRISDRSEAPSLSDLTSLIELQENAQHTYDLDQYRFMIVASKSGKPLGTVDFYEADWENDLAFIGILVADPKDRQKGAGLCALELLLDKMYNELELQMACARIFPDNLASIRLFEKAGFKKKLEEKHLSEPEAEYLEFVCELENR